MPVDRTPKGKPAAKEAVEGTGKEKQHDESAIFEGFAEWEISADSETVKEITSLSRQRDQVTMKVVRVQRALVAARNLVSLSQLRTYMKNIDVAYNEYSAVHSKLVAIIPQESFQQQEEVYVAFEDRYNFVRTTIDELIMAHENASVRSQAPQQQIIVQQQPLKAPIPTFDGDYANWPKFKAIFQDLMANSGDSNAIKLYHLDKALVGAATGALDAKVISEGNYQQAWTILTDRYENKRIIVETHVRGLFNLQGMSSGSHKEVRRLLDECTRHVESLKYLEQEFLGISDLFLVHMLTTAMDNTTRMAWEGTQKKGVLPKYAQTITFLQSRCEMLENCETAFQKVNAQPASKSTPKVQAFQPKASNPKVHAAATTPISKEVCDFCQGAHRNYQCNALGNMSFDKRMEKVRTTGVCFNCLRKGHSSKECSSPRCCQKCQKRHHTQLHNDEVNREPKANVSVSKEESRTVQPNSTVANPPSGRDIPSTSCSCNYADSTKTVFLLTAVVNVLDENNQLHSCRVLLDSGSQKHRVNVPICGINDVRTVAHDKVMVNIRSRLTDFQAHVECFGYAQSDPEFYKPDKIDMLLGAELFFKLMRPGHIKLDDSLPDLRETCLGWVLGGVFTNTIHANQPQHSLIVSLDDIEESIQRFWRLEEVPDSSPLTKEEQECEAHFVATHQRDENGRYQVRLPFKDNVHDLSDCRAVALKRFQMLQRRLQRNPDLKEEYVQFMREYEELGHCHEVREEDDPPHQQNYYLPHHAVLRPSSSTTKCRVVFDASAKPTVNNRSLNEVLQVGAVVQKELYDVILRFCKYPVAFTADVPKMYRQIKMHPRDTHYLRVFWCEQPSEPLRVLELTTVTYGTASAPFQATRCLQQLADDESTDFPIGAQIAKEDFYVDDALSGANSLPEALEAARQLEGLLKRGGFSLHKWCSNSKEFLDHIPNDRLEQPVPLGEYGPNGVIKVLGLLWDPKADHFLIARPPQCDLNQRSTKRIIYSEVAKLFDPLGLVSPVIVVAKLLVQQLWKHKIGWDVPVNDSIQERWVEFANTLPALDKIAIPRRVTFHDAVSYEIHGFADASSLAYGACVYVRSLFSNGSAKMKLLSSKSKVAPLHDLSTPRKELCAALLLTRLIQRIIPAMQMEFRDVVLWSDSQIVLAWMKRSADRLKIFVRNRIHEINTSTAGYRWCYIRSGDNPADIVSRGQLPNDLRRNNLWWTGPSFLTKLEYDEEELVDIPDQQLPEMTSTEIVTSAVVEQFPLFSRFSDFRKIERIMALVLRFIANIRTKNRSQRIFNRYVTISELRRSNFTIMRMVQESELGDEIRRVQTNKPCRKLGGLNPVFVDGLLRVGGRLQHSNLRAETKNPIILPNRHPLTKQLIRTIHIEHLHLGQNGLIAAMRQRYWLLSARSTIRQVTRNCVRCFRTNPNMSTQLMGNLPQPRINPAPPFAVTGVDYAGPFWIKMGNYRSRLIKAYVAVFVCMVTKAVHLEVVSDLTSDAFLAALQRFISRRGMVQQLHSDNATNFRGAQHELHQLYQQFQDQQFTGRIQSFCQPKEIERHFIPPNAPEFGGLWEAAVKSTKRHLVRVVGYSKLSFEELTTILTEIEAVLNSRPLFSISSEPADIEVITPAHYLIGRPLTAVPEPSLEDIQINRLKRWQHLQKMREDFWKSWSRDYLCSLQPRSKNTKTTSNLRPGMVVLLEDKNQPPLNWKLGRIMQVFPGPDGLVRAIDVSSNGVTYRRPINRIAVLPIEDNEPPTLSDVESTSQPGGVCSVRNKL
ncbi:uncharacterized protein LOC135711822 [Ochlerotatus camptorhynchus]|uniref:uncharacterized protein LOC135711822 n=1 Tax=Ochlerotatus camptorhynchus TaxID=644619 RepID=UPI0031DEF3E7